MIDAFQNVTVDVVGWTLLHLLWQTMAIYCGLLCIRACVGLAYPSVRYAFSCCAIAAVIAVGCLTAARHLRAADANFANAPNPVHGIPRVNAGSAEQGGLVSDRRGGVRYPERSGPSLFERASETLQPVIPSFVGAWFFGVMFMGSRHIIAVNRVRGLIRSSDSVRPDLQARFEEIAAALKLNRVVRFLQVRTAMSPFATGWFKPVVVLPIAVLQNCTVAEIDAIVAHELAHLRRLDRLIDFVQIVLETLLFFNPGIWLISQALEDDRELCSDREAAGYLGGGRSYAELLLRLQDCDLPVLRPQVGFFGRGTGLVQRIRALGIRQRGLHRGLADSWVAIIVAVLCVSVVGAQAAEATSQLQARREFARTPEWIFIPRLLNLSSTTNPDFDAAYVEAIKTAQKFSSLDDPRYKRLLTVASKGVDLQLVWRAFSPLVDDSHYPYVPAELPDGWRYGDAPTHALLVSRLWKVAKRLDDPEERAAAALAVIAVGSMRREGIASADLRPVVSDPRLEEITGLPLKRIDALRRYWAAANDAAMLAVGEVIGRYNGRVPNNAPLSACGERVPGLYFVAQYLERRADHALRLDESARLPSIVVQFNPRSVSR